MRLGLLAPLFAMCVASTVLADEPAPQPLPPPRVESAPVIYLRQNRWDVWQYYGVDQTGHFRPRVMFTPYGSFYLANGEPYPWITTHPRAFMPYVLD